jgi:hypothetical protein
MLNSVEVTVNNQLKTGQVSMEYASVLSQRSLLRNPYPKLIGVLVHCREGETNCWFSIFRGISI